MRSLPRAWPRGMRHSEGESASRWSARPPSCFKALHPGLDGRATRTSYTRAGQHSTVSARQVDLAYATPHPLTRTMINTVLRGSRMAPDRSTQLWPTCPAPLPALPCTPQAATTTTAGASEQRRPQLACSGSQQLLQLRQSRSRQPVPHQMRDIPAHLRRHFMLQHLL